MNNPCIACTGAPDAQTTPPPESNASPANITASTSGSAQSSTESVKTTDMSASSETTVSPANSTKSLNGDRRRTLSSKEYLLIKLCAKTASLGYLSKKFLVSREHIRRIVERDEGFCSSCQKWKASGEIVLDPSGEDIDWKCDGCLNTP